MTDPTISRARLQVACGPLADALVPRFVRALAAHTTLGIDRVEEAVLVGEALGRHCEAVLPGGSLELAVRIVDGGIELLAGPFDAGVPHRLLDLDAGDGRVLAGLAATEVRTGRDGRQRLHLRVV
ncbi:hypothetical protein [Paraconexibacter algicola]|uniref:ATP-binding protein n=1 Tax=Paraconexibacter algicola TaxID=2133960 RepID=A0A2T4UL77_9ACTN|nr:hypothetical protein [Paraconexibacter algicola]PTL59993.1 hypothetical protein C7Y72_10210 [Paraconexibacter algicola]